MSKVLIDRELLERIVNTNMADYAVIAYQHKEIRAILAQPEDPEGFEIARHSKRLVEQLRSDLSAVTAERDRLQKKWARVESERDKLRAEVDGLRSDALPDGFVSAPLEPSVAMQNAGWHEIASQGVDPEAVEIRPIYRAMIAAMAAKEA